MEPFVYRQKVLFQYCDPAGIVFYPRYFEMINAVVEAWFAERVGAAFEDLHGAMGRSVPTVTLQATFSAVSRHGDMLAFTLKPVRMGRTSLDLVISAHCDGQLRLEVTPRLVFMNKSTYRPERWPDEMREMISEEIRQLGSGDA